MARLQGGENYFFKHNYDDKGLEELADMKELNLEALQRAEGATGQIEVNIEEISSLPQLRLPPIHEYTQKKNVRGKNI